MEVNPMQDTNSDNDYYAETHRVLNQPPELANYNSFTQDSALKEAVIREGAAWAEPDLFQFGQVCGSLEMIELGFLANQNKPVLVSHDRFGHRIDEVRFHPAYHQLMQTAIENGLHSSHWTDPKPGAHVMRAAMFYLQSQVEAAHCCPVTMTSAAIPALRNEPEIADEWAPRIMSRQYDYRNVPIEQKEGITIGMAMTEKQGGSDVRANTTSASPLGNGGPGQAYKLVGHKFFVSAPMCDAFLVLAQAPGGLSCFLMPRWRPDGRKNASQIQRLKDKMGNVANASCETELRGAHAIMIGDEGRGVAIILEMVAMTRFDCMIGSTAGMRQAVAQASHHCTYRSAFGKRLTEQPLMQNVLADLVIEHEAALAMTMRIARALDEREKDEDEMRLARIGTAVGKYWICKRTPGHAYEAMECIGGSGVMEDCIMPRLFRESPVNSIWEGSGNVQCLDMLRAMNRSKGAVEAFMFEISLSLGGNKQLDRLIQTLGKELTVADDMEYRARSIVEKMALALQGALLIRHGNAAVAEAFCSSRLGPDYSGLVYGTLPRGIDCKAIIERATPHID
jgi:putative acyl-CoA dehydrogenase